MALSDNKRIAMNSAILYAKLIVSTLIGLYASRIVLQALGESDYGTIFSLIASTPVIVLQTTDHKVTTGADWFKGIYDDYVFVAQDLQDAHRIAEEILQRPDAAKPLTPYFADNYYAKLKALFETL